MMLLLLRIPSLPDESHARGVFTCDLWLPFPFLLESYCSLQHQ